MNLEYSIKDFDTNVYQGSGIKSYQYNLISEDSEMDVMSISGLTNKFENLFGTVKVSIDGDSSSPNFYVVGINIGQDACFLQFKEMEYDCVYKEVSIQVSDFPGLREEIEKLYKSGRAEIKINQ